MKLDLDILKQKYNLKITGVMHVGLLNDDKQYAGKCEMMECVDNWETLVALVDLNRNLRKEKLKEFNFITIDLKNFNKKDLENIKKHPDYFSFFDSVYLILDNLSYQNEDHMDSIYWLWEWLTLRGFRRSEVYSDEYGHGDVFYTKYKWS